MEVGALLSDRAMADVVAQIVRVRLGGETYELPVLPINASRRWVSQLDVIFAALLQSVEAAGDDADAVMVAMATDPQPFIELLSSYDRDGHLPTPAAIRELATELDVVIAVLEVWRAANPKVDIALSAASLGIRNGLLPRLTTSLVTGTAGRPPTSEPN